MLLSILIYVHQNLWQINHPFCQFGIYLFLYLFAFLRVYVGLECNPFNEDKNEL